MAKKSITIDLDEKILKDLHIRAIQIDEKRKGFIEECINYIATDEEILKKIEALIKQKKSPAN